MLLVSFEGCYLIQKEGVALETAGRGNNFWRKFWVLFRDSAVLSFFRGYGILDMGALVSSKSSNLYFLSGLSRDS